MRPECHKKPLPPNEFGWSVAEVISPTSVIIEPVSGCQRPKVVDVPRWGSIVHEVAHCPAGRAASARDRGGPLHTTAHLISNAHLLSFVAFSEQGRREHLSSFSCLSSFSLAHRSIDMARFVAFAIGMIRPFMHIENFVDGLRGEFEAVWDALLMRWEAKDELAASAEGGVGGADKES